MANQLSDKGLEINSLAPGAVPDGGADKVLLYASGSGSDARLYVKAGADSQTLLGIDIDQLDALGSAGVAQGDHLLFSDAGTEKKITFSNFEDSIFANVSGDATIAAGGALTIAAGSIEHGMLAEDIISGQANLGGTGVDDADEFMFSDGGTIKALTGANLYGWVFSKVSGDATVAAGGALTIANDAVEQAMIADDAVGADQLASNAVVNASVVDGALKADKLDIDGSTDIGAALADADLMLVDDGAGGTNRKSALSRVKKYIYSAISGDATASDAGALTIANDAVEQAMIADDAVGADQLASNAVVNASVASGAAIAANKLDFNVDLGGDITFGNQSDDTISTTGHLTVGGNLIVQGTTTTVDSTTVNISSSFTFEGPADAHETILHAGSPSQDITVYLPQYSSSAGAHSAYLAVLADAPTQASQAVTAAEFALLDGGSTVSTVTVADGDGVLLNDGGTMKQATVQSLAAYFDDEITAMPNLVTVSALNAGSISSGFGNIDNGSSTLDTGVATVSKLQIDSSSDYIDVDTDLKVIAAADIVLDPAGGEVKVDGNLLPNSDSADALGASGTAWSNLYVDAIDLNGQGSISMGGTGRIDLDADDDTSIRASADDVITFEAGGNDEMSMSTTALYPASDDGLALGSANNNWSDLYMADGAVMNFGDDQEVTLTHVHNTGLNLVGALSGSSTLRSKGTVTVGIGDGKIMLEASSGHITASGECHFLGGQSNNGMSVVASNVYANSLAGTFGSLTSLGVVDVTATTDASDASGDTGALRCEGGASIAKKLFVGTDLDVDGTANLDAVDIDGAVQADGTITVGADDTGYDVKFFGATSGRYFLWDESADGVGIGKACTAGYAIDVATGHGDVRADSFVTYSDRTLKTNIQKMDGALEKVMKLEAVTYDKKATGKSEIGFIAQDVAKVVPEICALDANGEGRGIDYSRMSTLLVGALKAQQEQIAQLKEIVAKLQK